MLCLLSSHNGPWQWSAQSRCILLAVALLSLERSEAHGSKAKARGSTVSQGEGRLDLNLRGVLGGRSLANYILATKQQGPKGKRVWIEVRAKSANAPSPSGMGKRNVLSVAVRAEEPVSMIKLNLPERQKCSSMDNGKVRCTGYSFFEADREIEADREDATGGDHGCDIVPWPYDQIELPESKSGVKVYDIQKENLIDSCKVDNTAGDNSPTEQKRSQMTLTIKQDDREKVSNTFLVFMIGVRNPESTPITRPTSEHMANTWQVLLFSPQGRLGARVIPAPKILGVWHCAYSDLIWTSTCTAKCGGGVKYGIRRLLHPPPPVYPQELLVDCGRSLSETAPCNEAPCDVDCRLGDWTPFADGPCSATCGDGFMVERRRVVEGPVGNGKVCPPWDKADGLDARVRKGQCKGPPCEPRCDLASPSARDATLQGRCSDFCNGSGLSASGGERSLIRVAKQKDFEATEGTCGPKDEKKPCGVKCRYVNFFPVWTNQLPRLGQWADIALILFLPVVVDHVFRIYAPAGFQIGKQGQDNQCLLKSHNLPRLKSCVVEQEAGGRDVAKFLLLNPLEPSYLNADNQNYRPRYDVRFLAKSPAKCEGGLDEDDACKDSVKKWHWEVKLTAEDAGGLESRADHIGGYYIYGNRAKNSASKPWSSEHKGVERRKVKEEWAEDMQESSEVNDAGSREEGEDSSSGPDTTDP